MRLFGSEFPRWTEVNGIIICLNKRYRLSSLCCPVLMGFRGLGVKKDGDGGKHS